MSYLSPSILSKLIISGQRPSPEEVLEKADLQKLFADLRRRKAPKHDFYCTIEAPDRFDSSQITSTDLERLDEIQQKILNNYKLAKKYLQELLTFSKKYPNFPKTFNYICVAYRVMEQEADFLATARATIERFPTYLFGKMNLCEYYLTKEQYAEIPKVLQHKMSLQQHFPRHIREFHPSEVKSFYHVIGSYYAETDDITLAMAAWLLIKEAAPDSIEVKSLAQRIMLAEIRALEHKMKNGLTNLPSENDLDLKEDLLADLKASLPFFVQPKKALIYSLKEKDVKLKSNERLKVQEMIDLGEEGGISCVIHSRRSGKITMASLTHLKFDRKHPLYKRVYEYQQLRTARLQEEQRYG